MNARVFSIFLGKSFSDENFSWVIRSGPCADMQLCSEMPPGRKPSAFASYSPRTRPISSLIPLRWNHGGRKVSSPTTQRGGKMTKIQLATPAWPEGEVSTVKIEGYPRAKATRLV